MPLLDPASVFPLTLGEASQALLRRAEHARNGLGFRTFLSHFGFYDLGDLNEAQAFAMVAARNVLPAIDLMAIPGAKKHEDSEGDGRFDLYRPKSTLGPAVEAYLASTPAHEQEWEVLRDPEDIPQAVPEDLLLRRRAPQEFLRRLTEGELLRNAWVLEEEPDAPWLDQDSDEDAGTPSEPGEDPRPHGYLLLDASESMGTERDSRSEVARGLALAFLWSQFRQGNPSYGCLFRHELGPLFGGEDRQGLETAAAAILKHRHEGTTSLQHALEEMRARVQPNVARLDILLITDGLTRLKERPLGDAHLHTFLLAAAPEELDRAAMAQYKESLQKLDDWSDFHFRFEPSTLRLASCPRREDLVDLLHLVDTVRPDLETAVTIERVRRVRRRATNLLALLQRYKGLHPEKDGEIDAGLRRTQELVKSIDGIRSVEIAEANGERLSPRDRALSMSIEAGEARAFVELDAAEFEPPGENVPTRSVPLWEVLKQLPRALRRWARGVVRAQRRRYRTR